MAMVTLWVALLFGLALSSPVSRTVQPAVVDCGCTTGNSTATSTSSTIIPGYGSPDETTSSTPTLSTTTANDTTAALSSSTQDGAVTPSIPLVPGSTTTSSGQHVTTEVCSTASSPSTSLANSPQIESLTVTLTATTTVPYTTPHPTFGTGDTTSGSTGPSGSASSLVTSTGVTTFDRQLDSHRIPHGTLVDSQLVWWYRDFTDICDRIVGYYKHWRRRHHLAFIDFRYFPPVIRTQPVFVRYLYRYGQPFQHGFCNAASYGLDNGWRLLHDGPEHRSSHRVIN